mgnify:FL=1|tara:strand:- start:491 stop:820 length:330 start_codon:yes stop_codon:yes gene_type:complete
MGYDAHINAYAAIIINIVLEAMGDAEGDYDGGGVTVVDATAKIADLYHDGVYFLAEELAHEVEHEQYRHWHRQPRSAWPLSPYVTYMPIPDFYVRTSDLQLMSYVLEAA